MPTHPAVERRHPPDALMRLANPVVRSVATRGGAASQLLLLHYRGRRTGRQFDTPIGYHLIDGRIYVLTNTAWRHNFHGGVSIEVTFRGRRRPADAVLIDDPDQVADLYQTVFDELRWKQAQRRLGLKVHARRNPTREEIIQA